MLNYSAVFSLRNLNGKNIIRLRISYNGGRTEIYTGISAEPSEWNPKTRTLKTKDKRARELNRLLNIADEIFLHYEVNKNRYPTFDEIHQEFRIRLGKGKSDKVDDILLSEAFEMYIKHQSIVKQWKEGTVKSYTSIKNHFLIFNPTLTLNKLKEADIIGIINYFQTAPKDFRTGRTRKPHRNTTVEKNIADFFTMLTWCANKGYYNGNLHETTQLSFKGTGGDLKEIVYLEWEELIELFYKDFGSQRLNQVRDVFCFLCFTGQRFSDVKKLQHSDIRENYFIVVTEKTIDPLRIDLNDYAKEILSRYTDYPQPLPIISHDKTNNYLKEIGEAMEWNTPLKEVFFVGEKRNTITHLKKDVISTHAGRRTFIVNAIKMNIPTIVVRTWTGHKDERAMKPYVKIVDELKSEEMKKFNKK